jgi:hypothetical protein
VEVPSNTRFLFSSKSRSPSKAIAKSVVYLLKPKSLALKQFEKLINFLEQFYHPSNGGRWTYSLERFLRYLVFYFERRLQHEQFYAMDEKTKHLCLGKEERAVFIKVVLKLLDRGQYSKDDSLAETVSIATSILSYVEPSLVLPFVATNFQLALETVRIYMRHTSYYFLELGCSCNLQEPCNLYSFQLTRKQANFLVFLTDYCHPPVKKCCHFCRIFWTYTSSKFFMFSSI